MESFIAVHVASLAFESLLFEKKHPSPYRVKIFIKNPDHRYFSNFAEVLLLSADSKYSGTLQI